MTTIPVWTLRPGDLFSVDDSGEVFRFDHMDGMHSFAISESTGQVLNWSGDVEMVK